MWFRGSGRERGAILPPRRPLNPDTDGSRDRPRPAPEPRGRGLGARGADGLRGGDEPGDPRRPPDRGGLLPRAPPDRLPRDQAAVRALGAGRRAHRLGAARPAGRARGGGRARGRLEPRLDRAGGGQRPPLRPDRAAELAPAPAAGAPRRRSRSRSTSARASPSSSPSGPRSCSSTSPTRSRPRTSTCSRRSSRARSTGSRSSPTAPPRSPGPPSGFADLDRITGGFQPGNLIILAARPGMGKSGLVANIAEHVAVKEKRPVAFFSLEMSDSELAQRLIAKRVADLQRQAAQGPGHRPRLVEGAAGLQRPRGQPAVDRRVLGPRHASTCGRRPAGCMPRSTPRATAAWR